MEKNIQMTLLLELYGKLLTGKQFDVIDLYYNNNLSLSEISEDLKITRQGVRKNLVSAESNLLEIESKVGFLAYKLGLRQKIGDISTLTEDETNFKESLLNLL